MGDMKNINDAGMETELPASKEVHHGHNHEGHDHHHSHETPEVAGIACACGSEHGKGGHSHAGVNLNMQMTVIMPLTVVFLCLSAIFYFIPNGRELSTGLALLAVAVGGGPIIWSAIKGLARGRTNVNELASLGITGALVLGLPFEAGLVALFMQVAAAIEEVVVETAQRAILALQNLAPVHARVRRGDKDEIIRAEELAEGDVIIVAPGERVAGDGQILRGSTSVDESMVTGEAIPVDKGVGSTVLAGTINLTGSAEVRVTRVGDRSFLSQTIALVRRAQAFQPPIVRAADKFFQFYTPIILGLSLVAWWVSGQPLRMVAMWVVGCPCAMLLASPLAIIMAMTRASRSGIQIKGGPSVEASVGIDTVVFDKTGTLTTGIFGVSDIKPAAGVSANELLILAARVENRSSHPLARAITAEARHRGLDFSGNTDVTILEGLGVEGVVNRETVRVGSSKIISPELAGQTAHYDATDSEVPVVPVYVTCGDRLMGAIHLTDGIRAEARRTIRRLRALGVKKIVMMTGDRRKTAQMVGHAVGCDDIYAELLPAQKVELVRQLQRGHHCVAMVGDGINDAPSLAAATVGIALGVRGTDAAIEAAGAILLKDDLTRVPLLIYLARQTRSAIYQNLGIALLIAIAGAALAAFGVLTVVTAAAAHVLAVVLIAANAARQSGSVGINRKPLATTRSADPVSAMVPAAVAATSA